MDWSLEDAAMDLGSPPMRTFWKITFPGVLPGVAGAFLLSLALSIDDYIITSFVAGPTVTFPRKVFDSARVALPAQVHVLATIIMLVAIVDHRRQHPHREPPQGLILRGPSGCPRRRSA